MRGSACRVMGVTQLPFRVSSLTSDRILRSSGEIVNNQRSCFRRAVWLLSGEVCSCSLVALAWGSAGFVSGTFGGGLLDGEDLRALLLCGRLDLLSATLKNYLNSSKAGVEFLRPKRAANLREKMPALATRP